MRWNYIVVVVSFVTVLGTTSLRSEPVCWDGHPDGQRHCYEYIRFPDGEAEDWATQQARAVMMGGHLVTITSAEEQQVVSDSVLPCGLGCLPGYAGALQLPGQPTAADGWEWVTGEPWTYTNWVGGEPNNNATENFLGIRCTLIPAQCGQWNDDDDGKRRGFVWEFETPFPIPAVSEWGIASLGLLLIAGLTIKFRGALPKRA